MVEVVRRGVDVVHSDIDAVWMNDPTKTILNLKVDVIGSRGSPEPEWLMCMGWVYLRATPTIIHHFLPRFLRRMVNIGDDQRAFNGALRGALQM